MILNLTQHLATPEQGVAEPTNKKLVQDLLTFVGLPTKEDIKAKASALANIAVDHGASAAMIGGAPYLLSALEDALKGRGIKSLYAYSERVSEERVREDGSVEKTNVFKHLDFVEV